MAARRARRTPHRAPRRPVLDEQLVGGHARRQAKPEEERSLATGLERAERLDDAIASRLVQRPPRGDRLLRASQRGDRGALERHENACADVLLQPRHAGDQLRVPEHEAEPPAGHAEALREGEELDADLARARLREEAPRAAAVEDEVAVGEVVQDGGSRLLRERDRLGEDAVGRGGRDRVRRVVEVDEGRRRSRERAPLGPAVVVERQLDALRAASATAEL